MTSWFQQRAAASALDPEKVKTDIGFTHDNLRKFVQAQRATVTDCTVEIIPGLMAGQTQIPVSAAGCHVRCGRSSHVASAGPIDSMVNADASADAQIVDFDLVGQAERGYTSPACLVTSDAGLAQKVMLRGCRN